MSIICDFTEGGITAAGTNAIIVNDGGAGTIHVVLSGLDLEGLGNVATTPGIRGVYFISGASLTVRNSYIRNFKDATNGAGIGFSPSTAAKLVVINTILSGNGNTGVGGGIVVAPTSAATADVSIDGATITGNANKGVSIVGTGTTGYIRAQITNSTISGNGNGIGVVTTTAKTQAVLQGNTISNNTGYGVLADGNGAKLWVSGNNITHNAEGLKLGATGLIQSFGDNAIVANTATVAPTPVTKS
jgi:hypothetical protein